MYLKFKKFYRDFLECLVIIVGKNAFYTNGLIDETIQGITKYHLIDSVELSTLAVNLIVSIVTKYDFSLYFS